MEAKRVIGLSAILVLLLCGFRSVQGHGHLMDPPARSSMWREGFKTPHNYNDNQLNCGGYYTQWGLNNGKCGICGDPYQNPQPRDNESGGRYGKGVVTRTYQQGQEVTIKVLITANHLGWFEFRLCPDGSPNTPVTQECLDKHVLELTDGSGPRYDLGAQYNTVAVKVKLPDGVTCKQCVIQWRWHAGNSFGQDSQGNWCKGCGSQEEFYGCADVAITGSGQTNSPVTQSPMAPVTYAPVTNAPIRPTFAPITNAPITFAPITNAPITFAPITNAPITAAPITFAPITAAPVTYTPRPFFTLPPFTNRPVTNAPITAAPQNTPRPYLTFPPATFRPVTNTPTNPPTPVATIQPITFQPIRTQAPASTGSTNGNNQRPIGFLPISVVPGMGSGTTAPSQTPIPASTRYPFFRPPTTARPSTTSTTATVTSRRPFFTFPPAATTKRPQPQTTSQPLLPTNFFRPSTTPRLPVTFTLPPSTPRPTFKPIVFTLVRKTSTSTAPTTTTTTQTTKPTTPPRTRPTFTLAPRTTPTATSRPTTPQSSSAHRCFGINSWYGVKDLDDYCDAQCNMRGGQCPSSFCGCA